MNQKKQVYQLKKSQVLFFITLVVLLLCSISNRTNAQTTIYTTDFGLVANVNPAGWTFTGIGMNISTNNASSGYIGASGGACLGEGNSVTFTNTAGAQQTVSPIGTSEAILMVSTSGFSNVALSFGMRKSSAGYNTNATYSLSWSNDGTNYNSIIYTEAPAGSWGLVTGAGLTLPLAAANQASLYIKWTFVRTGTASNFKIDDVLLTGNFPVITPATISFLSNDTTVAESVSSATIYARLTATSIASTSISVSVSALSNVTGSDYSLGVSTVTFAANAPVNSTAPIVINITNDAVIESAEYIILRLSNPQNAVAGSINQFAFYIADDDKTIPAATNALTLNLLSSFSNSISGANSAEIVAHDPSTQRLYIANSIGGKLDIVDFVNPSSPTLLFSVPITTYGNINSVAVRNGIVAAAIENGTNPQDSGKVVFFNKDGVFIAQRNVGMMPDMITFNQAGNKVITANEGEPNNAYTLDPDGSVSVITITGTASSLTITNVAHITFTAYNGQETTLRAQGIRIYGPGANASKDFEPEYVAVSKDDTKAWVSLQENNAFVEINLLNNSITSIKALGTKDHSLLNNGMDISNVTRGVNISNFPIKGFYLPDAIASYTVGGVNYIISANEGDARAYAGYSEETRIANANLDAANFPLATELKNNYVMGRLNITNKSGDIDNDGDLDTLYSYGSRSFSIWNGTTGNLVYDSKDDLEMITANNTFSVMFNASNTGITKKDRSDDKGPEPEGVCIGTVGSNQYAFIALERIGGVMVYDVTNPAAPVYVTYVNNRSSVTNGPDRGAEGLVFIPQSESPNGQHLVIAANEISSSLSIWGIPGCSAPLSSSISVTGNSITACSANPPVLSVVGNTAQVNYQWSLNGNLISGATSSSLAATSAGNYSVAISSGSNCSARSVINSVTVSPTPTLTIAGPPAICNGAATTQTVSGANSYSWSTGSTSSVVSLSPSTTTSYTITGTTNSCSSQSVLTITVNSLPQLSLSALSATLCAGQSASVVANGAATYSWSNGNSSATLQVNPVSNAAYTVTGFSTANCTANAVYQVSVNPNPLVQVTSSSSLICSGETATLSASGAQNYVWSSGSTSSFIVVSPSITTSYTVTGTDVNNCSSINTVQLNISDCTALTETAATSMEFKVFPNPAQEFITLEWNAEDNCSIAIYDALGSSVYNETGALHKSTIDIRSFAKGVYLIQLYSGKMHQFKKLIVN
ncbi:MAG: T9SS type A sorting domain-containing protein [Bacteroidia bacterium]|nr:T9SS type A sorting domain-containing protein [Bacteroidia bacterium]